MTEFAVTLVANVGHIPLQQQKQAVTEIESAGFSRKLPLSNGRTLPLPEHVWAGWFLGFSAEETKSELLARLQTLPVLARSAITLELTVDAEWFRDSNGNFVAPASPPDI